MANDEVHIIIETENVIEAVREHRLLWDPDHDSYNSKGARRRAWHDICRALMPDWDKFDEQDRNDIERKVQQRWRTARDCFVKARSARAAAPGSRASRREKTLRSYAHFNRLSFLEETLRTATGGEASSARAPGARRPRKRRAVRAEAGAGDAAAAADADGTTVAVFERLGATSLARRESPLEPDDEDFFRSLAPMLGMLDHSQKLQFRSRVLAVLQHQYRDRIEPYNYVTVNEQDEHEDEDEEEKYSPPGVDQLTGRADADAGH